MRFGPVPVAEAVGAILAHSRKVGGRRLGKGRVLGNEDVAALRDAGVETVIAARLDADDVHEDAAAERIAAVLAGAGTSVGAPFTGRANLFAQASGLLVVDAERLDAANAVDESITVATLPAWSLVRGKQMLATVKIIPFAAPRAALDAVCALLGAAPALRVAPLRAGMAVALVQTRLPDTRESVLDKTTRVLRQRVESLEGVLLAEIRCDHEAPAVADAVRALRAQGAEMVLVAGASAIVDRRDVVPAGIEAAGGAIEHFGMPVDPGNLLLLARLDGTPVLGLPGCARSPKFNGFDQVLQRLAAGLPVTPRDVTRLGVGGLLKEIAERPQPRSGKEPEARAPARAPHVAALVLAAGQSRRMGAINKLVQEVDGVAMVARAVDAARAAATHGVWVVTGHEPEAVRRALGGREVGLVHNPLYADGLSTSLAAGIAALPDDVEAVVVLLGDMPRVSARVVDRLIAAFDPVEGRSICVPTWRGKRGNPVLWARRFFPEMETLRGDVGARHLIGEHDDVVCEVAMDDDAVLLDVDSPDQLAALAGGSEQR
ncbi:MAG: NTP transferase domain-containing protein [Ectothiorhodospiraceae bacterium]|nr:NTP transferase domain-containing protein [Chromatiales bacterium]MCP5156998.1 NTP transferase domain-containing protein [Ectothiorhodospiraceae bacterium]